MATKKQILEVIEGNARTIEGLNKDLQASKDQIVMLSASNKELSEKVDSLERVIVQKCLEELK